MHQKKGQIGFYIVIGFVIFIVAGFYIYLSTNATIKETEIKQVSEMSYFKDVY